jgi:hypothetical protein
MPYTAFSTAPNRNAIQAVHDFILLSLFFLQIILAPRMSKYYKEQRDLYLGIIYTWYVSLRLAEGLRVIVSLQCYGAPLRC